MPSYYNCQECGERIEPYLPFHMYGIEMILCESCKEKHKLPFDEKS